MTAGAVRGGGGPQTFDFRTFTGNGPLSVIDGSTFTRASVAMVKDHDGVWHEAKSGELRVFGARRVDHADATDYGFGALGVRYYTTDESAAAIEGIEGFLSQAAQTNMVLSPNDLSTASWTRRGSLTATTATDTNLGTYTQVRGITGAGASDVYQLRSAFSANARYEPVVLMRRRNSSTGQVVMMNPQDGTLGAWIITMSSLTDNVWTEIDRDHAAVSVLYEFRAGAGGQCGIHFARETGSSAIDIDVKAVTLVAGTTRPVTPLPVASQAADALTVGGETLAHGYTLTIDY